MNEWETARKPIVPFFFSVNSADTRSNTKFSSTIAVNLASLDDFGSFRSALAETLGQRLAIESLSFNSQFEQLVFDPLKKANKPVLLVLDALDECDKAGRSDLPSLLLNKLGDLPRIKVLITSRPESDIDERLRKTSIVLCSDIQAGGDVDIHAKDIHEYISQIFAQPLTLRHFMDRAQVFGPAPPAGISRIRWILMLTFWLLRE